MPSQLTPRDNYGLDLRGGRALPARAGREIERLPSTRLPPIHRPGPIEFGAVGRDRDACWAEMTAKVRRDIDERTGDILAWWADANGMFGRVNACVFGERGLCFASPVEREGGTNAYSLSTYEFVEGRIRRFGALAFIFSAPFWLYGMFVPTYLTLKEFDSSVLAFLRGNSVVPGSPEAMRREDVIGLVAIGIVAAIVLIAKMIATVWSFADTELGSTLDLGFTCLVIAAALWGLSAMIWKAFGGLPGARLPMIFGLG